MNHGEKAVAREFERAEKINEAMAVVDKLLQCGDDEDEYRYMLSLFCSRAIFKLNCSLQTPVVAKELGLPRIGP